MDNINEIQTQMKTIQLTQQQIDRLYFSLKDYIKTIADIDKLSDLTSTEREIFRIELELIEKFSEL
jgi:predicted nucleotide-binding protein (sugar kinase/HSP70/actin superfamily)